MILGNQIRAAALLVGLCALLFGVTASEPLESPNAEQGDDPATPRNLLKTATKLVRAEAFVPGPVWLDDDRLVLSDVSSDEYRLNLYSRRTGQLSPLRELNGKLAAEKDLNGPMGQLSPDRKWLLWGFGPVKARKGWLVLSVDGRRAKHVAAEDWLNSPTVWRRDSRGWFAIDGSPGGYAAQHYGVDSGKAGKLVTLPRIDRRFDSPGGYASSYGGLQPIGMDSGNLALFIPWGPSAYDPLPLYKVDIEKGSSVRKQDIHLPKNSRIDEVVVSNQGTRIGWLIYRKGGDGASIGPAQDTVEVWVSKADGTGMQSAGFVPVEPLNRAYFGPDFPHQLGWLPSGKEMSFIVQDFLWVFRLDDVTVPESSH